MNFFSSKYDNNLALSDEQKDWTYGQLRLWALRKAKRLQEHHIQAQDRVVLWGTNGAEMISSFLAVWLCGAVPCPLNIYFDAHVLQEYIRALQPRCLLHDGQRDLTGLSCFQLHWAEQAELCGESHWQDLSEHSWASIMMSSGSTGFPKAIVQTWAQHTANAQGAQAQIALDSSSTWLLTLPLFHVAGLAILIRCWLQGARVLLADPMKTKHSWSHMSAVMTQLHRYLKDEKTCLRLGQCQAILCGGSAMDSHILLEGLRRGWPLYGSYGLTEMGSQVATSRITQEHCVSGFCAPVLPGREVKIGPQGQIFLRGKTRFEGYWKNAQLERPFDSEGWFESSDLGQWNERGELEIRGRRDDLIICGGENIFPQEIEKALQETGLFHDLIVVAEKDTEYGQVPVAFVNTKCDVDLQKLRAHCAATLPGLRWPRAFYQWPETLPSKGWKRSRKAFQQLLQSGYKSLID